MRACVRPRMRTRARACTLSPCDARSRQAASVDLADHNGSSSGGGGRASKRPMGVSQSAAAASRHAGGYSPAQPPAQSPLAGFFGIGGGGDGKGRGTRRGEKRSFFGGSSGPTTDELRAEMRAGLFEQKQVIQEMFSTMRTELQAMREASPRGDALRPRSASSTPAGGGVGADLSA